MRTVLVLLQPHRRGEHNSTLLRRRKEEEGLCLNLGEMPLASLSLASLLLASKRSDWDCDWTHRKPPSRRTHCINTCCTNYSFLSFMITVSCYSVFVQLLVLWCPDEDAYRLVLTAPTIRTISSLFMILVLPESSRRGEHICSVTNFPFIARF